MRDDGLKRSGIAFDISLPAYAVRRLLPDAKNHESTQGMRQRVRHRVQLHAERAG